MVVVPLLYLWTLELVHIHRGRGLSSVDFCELC